MTEESEEASLIDATAIFCSLLIHGCPVVSLPPIADLCWHDLEAGDAECKGRQTHPHIKAARDVPAANNRCRTETRPPTQDKQR